MRIAPAMLAVFVSALLVPFGTPVTSVPAARAASSCTNWSSTTTPPKSIRVYRVSEGKVDTVDFKAYVIRVVSSEWNVKQGALRRAGAVAAKQFAWYHVLHYRGGTYNGHCYDVKDTTADQLYQSKSMTSIPRRVKKAVSSTWGWTVVRSGKFIMTGYRVGTKKRCAADAGYRLYAKSAKRCAAKGWSPQRILEVYYTANVRT